MDHDALAAHANSHAGAFTTAHALASGWTRREVHAARADHIWKRLYEGAFVSTELWKTFDAEARALCTTHARLLVVPSGWHAARQSAAIVHGLPLLGTPPAVPQLVRSRSGPRARANSTHERVATLSPSDVEVVAGCPVTSLARTVVDLAREQPFRDAVAAADAALHQGLDPAELAELASRCRRWPGARKMLEVVAFADGRSESPLESISRVLMHELGLEPPEPQVEIRVAGRLVARVDFLWRAYNLVGEADGRLKYQTPADFYAEKLREQLLEDLGFEVVRWGWAAATQDRGQFESTIRRGFRRGALNQLDPRVRLVSSTLGQALAA